MKTFLNRLLSSEDPSSSKRFVTLIIAAHFIMASFIALFFVFYLILYTPKGAVNKDLLELLKEIMQYDFYIILSGLGFITAEGLVQILLEKAKVTARAAENIAANSPQPIQAQNVEQVTVNQPVKPDNPDGN